MVDMYDTFSEIMAEKTLNYIDARKANIMMEDNIEHDGSCDEVHPDKSHEEWEEDQEEFVQNEQMNMASTESVISKIQECYSSKMPVNINIDGEQLQINPTFARDIILLHDELNEENQAELRELIESDNIESFAKVMKFTEDRN